MRAIYTFFVAVSSVIFFGGSLLILGPIQAVFMNRWPHRGDFLPLALLTRRLWAKTMLFAHGVKVELKGPYKDKFNQAPSMIFTSNHQSALDILVFLAIFRSDIGFLAKKELLSIPVFGWGAWFCGVTYIDRSRGTEHREALQNVSQIISKGGSIVFYPEGTRSPDGGLLPFKRGAFVTAIDLKASVLPICICNSHKLMPKKAGTILPGTVEIWFEEPVSTKDLTTEDRFSLSDQVRESIAKRLDQYTDSLENA